MLKGGNNYMGYLSSWDFWFYIYWLSIAIGWGLSIGVGLFFLIVSLIIAIFNLDFKRSKE